jgi:hypothetical protein
MGVVYGKGPGVNRPTKSTLSSSLTGLAISPALTATSATCLSLWAHIQHPLATGNGSLIGRSGRLETASEVGHLVGSSLSELGCDDHRGLAGGTLGVEGLDALDVSADLHPLTLDCGVAADGLDVTLVGLGGGEAGGSGLSGFHVCMITWFRV